MFAQLCEMSNTNAWDTEKAVLVGLGQARGGDGGLLAMTDDYQGIHVDAPWVQNPVLNIWADFLGAEGSPRKQIVLLDKDLNKRYQFGPYSGNVIGDDPGEEGAIEEILAAIAELVAELDAPITGDLDGNGSLNILDIIQLVSMVLGNSDPDLIIGDMNGDGGLNILDIVVLVDAVLTDE